MSNHKYKILIILSAVFFCSKEVAAEESGQRAKMTPEEVVSAYLEYAKDDDEKAWQFIVVGYCPWYDEKAHTWTIESYDPRKEKWVRKNIPQNKVWGDDVNEDAFYCGDAGGGMGRSWVIMGYQISPATVIGLAATVPVVFQVIGKRDNEKFIYDPHYRLVHYYLGHARGGWIIFCPYGDEVTFCPLKNWVRVLRDASHGKVKPGYKYTYPVGGLYDPTREDVVKVLKQLKKWSWPKGKEIPFIEYEIKEEWVYKFAPCWLAPTNDYCQEWVRKRGPLANEPP